MKFGFAGFAAALLLAMPVAHAQGFWLPTGDQRLRDDVTLLVDEGVILLPTTTWPIPAADVREAVGRVQDDSIGNLALVTALQRVRDRVAIPQDADKWDSRDVTLTAGRAPLVRDYGTLGRDSGGFQTTGGTTNGRWSTTVSATGVFAPRDGQRLRWDGSDVSIRWGNWIFSANELSRNWGPGFVGSLILSNNARPMPQMSLDRMSSKRSSVPVLSWIGPWRFSGFLAATESGRPDINNAKFMGMRFTFQPLPIIEVGVTRSAQFCGQNLAGTRPSCGLSTIGRMVLGKDNTGYHGTTTVNEPGNQMAGFDLRVTSPFRVLPVAIYSQMIAEDNGSGIIPNRWLAQFGGEAWSYLPSGAVLRGQIEYSQSNCKWYAPAANADCAYRQYIFYAGYRYRGASIGHPTDADSETWALRLALARPSGDTWSLKLRHGRLDAVGGIDVYNPLTRGPSKYDAGEVGWQGVIWGQDLRIQVGYEQQGTDRPVRQDGPYGYLQWRRSL
jgi:hypothetical protein